MNLKKALFVLAVTVTASVACQKEPDPFMTLSDKSIAVGFEGGKVDVTLAANVYYRVNNDIEWATVSVAEQNGDSTRFSIAYKENTSFEPRSGSVRFIGDKVTPLKLMVNQAAAPKLGVDPETIQLSYATTSAQFQIYTDVEWTAVSDNSAFVLDATSGYGDAKVTVTFPENATTSEIKANITVTTRGKNYTCAITQAGQPKKEYVDLSANGTSNCYIVDKAGYFKFKATVRGNGVKPESQTLATSISPASVKVLWTSFGTGTMPTDDSVITGVELKDGYIQFATANLAELVKGNVVIAALDGSGVIIWSWHIWVTDPVAEITVSADKWMDRNLGAMCANVKNDPLAFGLHYQWGRKDPFRCAQNFDEDVKLIATTGTWPDPVLISEGKGGIENSIKDPQTFWYVKDSKTNNKDWIWGAQYDDLWGAGAEASTSSFTIETTRKSMFDPCPAGYCIPTSKQHKTLSTTCGLDKSCIDLSNHGMGNDSFWLCYPSGPVYDSGRFDAGSCQPVGNYSWYAGSCTNGINMLCTRSHTTACNFGGAASGRSAGYTVRCVKE